jgi:hypothetical protein
VVAFKSRLRLIRVHSCNSWQPFLEPLGARPPPAAFFFLATNGHEGFSVIEKVTFLIEEKA